MLAHRHLPMLPVSRFPATVGRLFDDLIHTLPTLESAQVETSSLFLPEVDLFEDEANLYLEADLPGFQMDDLQVLVQDDTLILRGQRTVPERKNVTWHRFERGQGNFERTFQLPCEIEQDRVEAQIDQGLLRVLIPKASSARPHRIEIKAPSKNSS